MTLIAKIAGILCLAEENNTMANKIIDAVKYVLMLNNGTFTPFCVTVRFLKPSHTPSICYELERYLLQAKT